MRRTTVIGIAVLVVAALAVGGPARADLRTLDQASYILAFSDPGTATKKVTTKFGFLWYPAVKRGAPGGYLLSFECNRARKKGGKAVVSNLKLTGADSGDTMSFGKTTGRFDKDETGRIVISRRDLQSLADESVVMVTGKVQISSNIEGAKCFIYLTEFLNR